MKLITAQTVRQLIDGAADRQPQKIFLIEPESGYQLCYGDLRQHCKTIAAQFREHGLEPGDRVALLGENGAPLAEHLLASMYAGFVPVPLNVLAEPLQLASILEYAGAQAIYASDAQVGRARSAVSECDQPIGLALLDGGMAGVSARDETSPEGADHDGGLLIYTSGTTARPRGALFNQAKLLACAVNTVRSHELNESDRLLGVLPLYHMNAVDKLLGTLLVEGAVVLPARFQLGPFWSWVLDYRCTWLSLVPAIIAQLLSRHGPTREKLAHVRYVRSSSAPLSAVHREAFEARFGIPIVEGMGMTEAGSVFLNPPPPGRAKPGAVGTAPGFEVKVTDEHGNELDVGQAGSVWIRGPAVMQEYYREPEATARVLDAAGWLSTGDIGFLDDEGFLFLTGRSKEIILKGGVSVAPSEIDEVLHAHPSVLEAAAVGVPDTVLGQDIVAYVVTKPDATCDPYELIEFCRGQLGTFKTPRRVYVVENLPRGPSGKVQRLKLETPESDRNGEHRSVDELLAAQRPNTQRLAQIWADILGLDHIDTEADFFEMGGDSLLATELTMRLEREFAVGLSLENLLVHPTVSAQAKLLQTAVNSANHAFLLAPVAEGCTQTPLFCIHGIANYRALAVRLGQQQPTYGLSPNIVLDLRGREEPESLTLGAIAARYLAAMREAQPHGPYYLAGFSFGGRVALEMAHLLHQMSEEVALLAIIDTYLCCIGWRYKLHWVRYHLGQIVRRGPGHLMDRARHTQVLQQDHFRARTFDAQLRKRAREVYSPHTYPGDIVLFRALDRYGPAFTMDTFYGWKDVAEGRLDVYDVPGDHYSMLREPNVEVLATHLRAYLTP